MTAEERKETKTWERFCREQARESATKFFDKVRRFKERNPSTSDIHDSVFANEFSAAFLEESVTVFIARITLLQLLVHALIKYLMCAHKPMTGIAINTNICVN